MVKSNGLLLLCVHTLKKMIECDCMCVQKNFVLLSITKLNISKDDCCGRCENVRDAHLFHNLSFVLYKFL